MRFGICRRSHDFVGTGKFNDRRRCRAFQHCLKEKWTFKPPVSKKFSIVGAKHCRPVALHVHEQLRDGRFAVHHEEARMVFGQAHRIPGAINFLMFATGNAVILKTRINRRIAREEVFAQVIARAIFRDIGEKFAVLGVARITRAATPHFHGTFLFTPHAIKPLRGTQRCENTVLGRRCRQENPVRFEEEIMQAEFGEELVESRKIPTFREPHAPGLTSKGPFKATYRHI